LGSREKLSTVPVDNFGEKQPEYGFFFAKSATSLKCLKIRQLINILKSLYFFIEILQIIENTTFL